MKTIFRFIAAVVLLLALTPLAHAQQSGVDVSRTISYQGVLARDGVAVPDGDYSITVTLYRDAGGAHWRWPATGRR